MPRGHREGIAVAVWQGLAPAAWVKGVGGKKSVPALESPAPAGYASQQHGAA